MLCSNFSKRRWCNVCHDVARCLCAAAASAAASRSVCHNFSKRRRELLRAGCGGRAVRRVDGMRLGLPRVLHRWLLCSIVNRLNAL